MCCPTYTIRLNVGEFTPSKDQKKSVRRLEKYLSGGFETLEIVMSLNNPPQICQLYIIQRRLLSSQRNCFWKVVVSSQLSKEPKFLIQVKRNNPMDPVRLQSRRKRCPHQMHPVQLLKGNSSNAFRTFRESLNGVWWASCLYCGKLSAYDLILNLKSLQLILLLLTAGFMSPGMCPVY